MKEILSPKSVMEKMVDKLQKLYLNHDQKAEGIIQFHLKHNSESIDCFIQSDFENLILKEGVAENPTVTVKSSFYNWLDLAGGKLNPVFGVMTGKLKFRGDTSFFNILPQKSLNGDFFVPSDPVTKFEKNPIKHWKKPRKVIVLSASPRGEKGYTDFYLKPFIEGMKKETEVELIHLNQYKINSCTGCFSCWMNVPGQCIYENKDDFHILAEKMFEADVTVYAFPIYADGMPGILKNYFDRSVSRAYPYMIEGMKRVRHPRRYINENHSMLIFSICGFFEMINFEPVRAYFKALAHNRHTPIVGEIYRTTAVGLYSNPFAFKKLNNILSALENAGEEIIEHGKIKQKTQKIINLKFGNRKSDLVRINEWWNEKKGSKDTNY
ncbi:MAG: NAD(P)H-dependent oxidoreductase [Bacteroidales bacterium]|jgi:putative sterol carrier protein/putative NADPH-quinone reductase|nr:NAD(P)H-dependent oxidoreductase [Bacteroidales bacterium]